MGRAGGVGTRTPDGGFAKVAVGSALELELLAVVLAALDLQDDDEDDDGRQVQRALEPVAGVCDGKWSHCCAEAERSQRPRLVKATMTASIQYWERVASRTRR